MCYIIVVPPYFYVLREDYILHALDRSPPYFNNQVQNSSRLVFQIMLLGEIGQKWTFWAVLRPLEVNLTRKYTSDIYKSIVL